MTTTVKHFITSATKYYLKINAAQKIVTWEALLHEIKRYTDNNIKIHIKDFNCLNWQMPLNWKLNEIKIQSGYDKGKILSFLPGIGIQPSTVKQG
jgi:hypothetical protein